MLLLITTISDSGSKCLIYFWLFQDIIYSKWGAYLQDWLGCLQSLSASITVTSLYLMCSPPPYLIRKDKWSVSTCQEVVSVVHTSLPSSLSFGRRKVIRTIAKYVLKLLFWVPHQAYILTLILTSRFDKLRKFNEWWKFHKVK